jgi:hypothetical protein
MSSVGIHSKTKVGDEVFDGGVRSTVTHRFGDVLVLRAARTGDFYTRNIEGGGWLKTKYGWTCCVYQGHYGHFSGKPTWLYVCGIDKRDLPELRWGKTEQRIHPRALELHGYEKARRIGMVAMVGGKDKTRIRNGTPPEFRDVLIDIARRCRMPALEPA